MKIKNEIQAVCASAGVPIKGFPDQWNDLKVLGIAHSVGAVVRDFEDWLSENAGDDFPKGVLTAYLRVASDRLGAETASGAAARSPEVRNLTGELSVASGGVLAFSDKHRVRLAETLQFYPQEEILSAFRGWFEEQDDDPKWAAQNFVQKVDDLCYAARRIRKQKEAEDAAREATRIRLQEEAEAERQRVEREKQEEAEAFDPLA